MRQNTLLNALQNRLVKLNINLKYNLKQLALNHTQKKVNVSPTIKLQELKLAPTSVTLPIFNTSNSLPQVQHSVF